jgi:hypothetical protein
MRVRCVTDEEFRAMVRTGALVDAGSVAAYALCAVQR